MNFPLPNTIHNSLNQFNTKLLKMESRCHKCAVNSICLPTGLSGSELQELESVIDTSKIINKGHSVFTCGERFNSLYVVHSGMFKTTVIDESGKERIISFHLPGEIMGFDGIHSDVYHSSASALTMSSYCKIPYNELLDVAEDFPVIQRNLLKVMSREIYNCKKNHLDISSKAKLALFILTLAQRFKSRGYSDKEYFLPISQRDIASYLGMAEQTLSRIFTKLQKQEIIKYKKHSMTILNKKLLTEISEI